MIKPSRISIANPLTSFWKQNSINQTGFYYVVTLNAQINSIINNKNWYILDFVKNNSNNHFLLFKLKPIGIKLKKKEKKKYKTIKQISLVLIRIIYTTNIIKKILFKEKCRKKKYILLNSHKQERKKNNLIKLLKYKKKKYSNMFYLKNWAIWINYHVQQKNKTNIQLMLTNVFDKDMYINRLHCLYKKHYSRSIIRLRKRLIETLLLINLCEITRKAKPALLLLIVLIKRLKAAKLRKFSTRACKIWQNNIKILRLASILLIKGYKLSLNGKVKRNMRKAVYIAKYGNISAQQFIKQVDFTQHLLVARVGVINANLWIFF